MGRSSACARPESPNRVARATFAGENWIARFGHLLDKAPSRQYNILYDTLVNAIRDEIPQARAIWAKASSTTSPERQSDPANDATVSARLVVLANGLNIGLRHQLGIARKIVSACHSISIGFDIVPVGRTAFDFPALTYFSERPSDRIPYMTLFPIGTRMRANLFVYRGIDDPWLREMRAHRGDPRRRAAAAAPHRRRLRYRRRHQDPPGRSLCETGHLSPASCWSATPSRPPARSPAPAPTRCSPTSSGSATSTSRHGSRPTAWMRTRSRPSMTIRSRGLRSLVVGQGVQLPLGLDRDGPLLAGAALGAILRLVGEGSCGGCATLQRELDAAVTPRRRPHPRHRRLHCRRRPERRHRAACGPGRPRACDRRRWRQAAWRASRARSPCRLKSR